ncbi:Protein FAM192A [Merluccius polli]|uniref:Protein FAM192A n=1 Tax=Merluccius polli TaxID=89951 RepID=A0AA47NYJ9_MERPO|nr:Protein FAM192A [Merluccius polli]
MEGGVAGGGDLTRKFVSEAELDEKRKKRQEEWEQVRKPEDPEEAPEEDYDHRCLFERLQEQKDKKQEEFEEQFKFKNMVKGLDEDESHFLDEVSRQQSLVEKQRRDEEKKELLDALVKRASGDSHKEPEKKAGPKLLGAEQKTSHLSQAHLLAGAVKRRSSSQSSDSGKKPKVAMREQQEEEQEEEEQQEEQQEEEPLGPRGWSCRLQPCVWGCYPGWGFTLEAATRRAAQTAKCNKVGNMHKND